MKQNTKKIMALGLLGLTALSAGAVGVSAYNNGLGNQDGTGLGMGQGQGMHDNSFRNNNWNTDDLTEDQLNMITQREAQFEEIQTAIDAEDYDLFVEAHENMNRPIPSEEEFNEIIARQVAHEKVEQAIEDGNYNVWLSAVQEMPYGENIADIISEDEFELYTQMHDYREEGNNLEANNIAQELGLDQIMPRGNGEGRGMKGNGQGLGTRDGTGLGMGQGSHQGNGQGQGMHRMN